MIWQAPRPSIDVSVEPERVTIVEPVTVRVRVTAPADLGEPAFDPPLYETLADAGWTVVSISREPPAVGEATEMLIYETEAVIEPFLAGEYTVPPLVVTFEDAAAVVSEPKSVEVEGVATEKELEQVDPSRLTGPASLEEPAIIVPWVVGGGAVVLAALAIWLLAGRSRPRARGELREAMAALARAGDFDADAVAKGARRVLAASMAPDAPALTGRELRTRLDGTNAAEEAGELLDALERLDDERFAGRPEGATIVRVKEAALALGRAWRQKEHRG